MFFNAIFVSTQNPSEKSIFSNELTKELRIEGSTREESVQNLINLVMKTANNCGLESNIKDLGIDHEDLMENIDALAVDSLNDLSTFTNPNAPGVEDMKNIILKAYNGDAIEVVKYYER